MKRRDYLLLWLAAAILLGVIGFFQTAPGYMDAEYYYGMGLRIANEGTLTEPFLWNYLHQLRELPHPGFTYWQPLPAFVAAGGILLSGLNDFSGARLGLLLLASFIPAVTANLGWEITKEKRSAVLAGLFALFPVLYAPFLGTTDAFGLMMVLGAIYLIAYINRSKTGFLLVWGLSAGLIHLTRSDGLIWLSIGLVLCALDRDNWKRMFGLFSLGYLIAMGPWLARNLLVLGEILPSGTGRMFWLKEYNEIFSLVPADLNPATWMGQGPGAILSNINNSVGANLKTAFFVQGQLILAPLAAIGFWVRRKNKAVMIGSLLYVLLFALMSIIFPFAGWRGGFLHAAAGIQPLIWVMSAVGFSKFIDWGVRNRNWMESRAHLMFGAGLVVVLAAATGYAFWTRVIGSDPRSPVWEQSENGALMIDAELDRLKISNDELLMINNPPGMYAAAGRPAIVIPFGPIGDLLQASEEFGVRYLILEANHPPQLDQLYLDPEGNPALIWIGSKEGAQIFEISGADQ